jgi:hypothetical protein
MAETGIDDRGALGMGGGGVVGMGPAVMLGGGGGGVAAAAGGGGGGAAVSAGLASGFFAGASPEKHLFIYS